MTENKDGDRYLRASFYSGGKATADVITNKDSLFTEDIESLAKESKGVLGAEENVSYEVLWNP